MFRMTLRSARSASVALLSVLAIAVGATAPVHGVGSAAPAIAGGATTRAIAASTAARVIALETAWEARASAPPSKAGDHGSGSETPLESLRPGPARWIAPAELGPSGSARAFKGRNHFWIPSLGMSYGVRPYACMRTDRPGDFIYRWGCAGRNNVYILGHNGTVMKPLHDLYVSGRLHKGLIALYADGNGRIRAYAVTEWRVVLPTEVEWQIAAQPVPSMTLQTCVGPKDKYRLNVRLVAVD